MKRKPNGKAGSPRMARAAGDDPGFTATEASSSRRAGGTQGEASENRDSGLKQAGLSDVGGSGPRRRRGK
jgi:hypothetical protein